MGDKAKLRRYERRIEAKNSLPPLKRNDSESINFRYILIERAGLGVEKLSERDIASIRKIGYDAFFIALMNSHKRIGAKLFYKLSCMQKIVLTTEYVVFHNFRGQLNGDCRKKIAALLLKEDPSLKS